MGMITRDEFYTIRVFELDNVVYGRIKDVLTRLFGDKGEGLLRKHMFTKFCDFCACEIIDFMVCFTLI